MKEGCNPFWIYKEDYEQKSKFFYEITHLEQWDLYSIEDHRQVFTKMESDSNKLSVCYKVKVNANILYPLLLLTQIENFENLIQDLAVTKSICKKSDYRDVLHVEGSLPWPLANREFYICRSISFEKEKKGFYVNMSSANSERMSLWEFNIPN